MKPLLRGDPAPAAMTDVGPTPPRPGSRPWGQSLLLDIAAKQHVVPLGHMFSAEVSVVDQRQLKVLARAAERLQQGQADGAAFRRLLWSGCADPESAAVLSAAAGPASLEEASLLLAFTYIPFQVSDAFAANVVHGRTVKQLAAMIDPAGGIAVRTRLFMADRLAKDKTVGGLVACTSSVAILRANGPSASAELAEAGARARLHRLGTSAAMFSDSPAAMAEALRCCQAGDWWNAEALARRVCRPDAAGCDADPGPLADLLLLSLLPTCETSYAIERITSWLRYSIEPDVYGARADC